MSDNKLNETRPYTTCLKHEGKLKVNSKQFK